MEFNVNGAVLYCATTLRVVYTFKEDKQHKTLQDALNALRDLNTDDQFDLLYSAYKCDRRNTCPLDKFAFIDMLLDNFGILKLTEITNAVVEGLLYSGLSQEEIGAKKAMIQKVQAGMDSSDMPVD